ncbi:MAG: hypothetical protein ACHQRJ_04445 [Alphaproteobacteria bacterium]
MSYDLKDPFWQFVDHWQTLITGLLALLAALGTIWVTIRAANREISAAQDQTEVAQKQIATTLRLERRRLAREAHAFFTALEAAMGILLENIEGALKIFDGKAGVGQSPNAYRARQNVKQISFSELRDACLRYGGHLSGPFLWLDKATHDFAEDWIPGQSPGGLEFRLGLHAGYIEQADRLRRRATELREEAAREMKRYSDELAMTQDD